MKTTRRDFLKSSAAAVAGSVALGSPVSAASSIVVPGQRRNRDQPRHNDRAKGYLRFLWEKATTPDDWSYRGDEELPWGIQLPRGEIDFTVDGVGPHPWWDQYGSPPYFSYPRFDLSDSGHAVLMMADQTPAWREVYARIMDELATRYTAYWAAIDWNSFIGPSPQRGMYPPQMMAQWPERLHGNYDFPGWTANGVEPWGLQRDPIGADGNLFFRGWLNLLLATYKYVSGDDKWEQPWMIAGYENEQFEWTQPRIVERLHQQYIDRPEGPHCENTKVWPICNSAAGLGIYLSDQLGVTNAHGVFENWIEFAKDNYMGNNDQNQVEWMTFYYDPLEDFQVRFPGGAAATAVAFYLLPQSPELGTILYDAVANASGWRNPRQAIRPNPLGLALARALGDHTAVARLTAAGEAAHEPRFFGDDDQMFGWFNNRGEPWPRGQDNGRLLITEIQDGDWMEVFTVRNMDKYDAPTVEGIDYPTLGVEQAWNDKESGVLYVGTYAIDAGRRGAETTWRVTNVPNPSEVFVLQDGVELPVEVTGAYTIEVRTTIDRHNYQIYTGYRGEPTSQSQRPDADPVDGASLAARTRTAAENLRAAESVAADAPIGCACC